VPPVDPPEAPSVPSGMRVGHVSSCALAADD
jgi:hypothetical protein